jgi:hypothetical protein
VGTRITLCHRPQRLVLTHRSTTRTSTRSADRSPTSGSGWLPPPQPVLQTHFILNTCGQWGPRVGTGSTLSKICRCGLLHGTSQLPNALIDYLLVVYRVFSGSLSPSEAWNANQSIRVKSGAVQQVLKG